MPASWRRGREDRVKSIVVERDGVNGGREAVGIRIEPPTPTANRIFRRSHAKRQASAPTEVELDSDSDSDSEDELLESPPTATRPFTLTSSAPTKTPAFAIDTALPQATDRAPANKGPASTVGASSDSAPESSETISMGERQGGISQSTEHLLIAAGSIGATIVIVMIVLGLYTMRKRGMSFADAIRKGKDSLQGKGAPPLPPKYGMDKKQDFDDDSMYVGKDVYPPRPAAAGSRSGSLSTQTPLYPLAHSNSFTHTELNRNNANGKSFVLANAPARQNSHRRDISATPSSPVLPIQTTRRSDSTHNTRSLRDEEEALDSVDPPRQLSALPAPPTFRQFLSNRPSISQRPGLGGAMASRFSWTNSQAPQTPHDPSRDTALAAPALGRDSFMTSRSSVPRFRTINSWVNQQSTRIEEQRLKQQFRMTQSTTYSDDGDNVPEMPPVPKCPEGKDKDDKSTRHQRHDTVDTAPIFKQHPGTEVRFSTRSTVPSEVLDMGRRNAAL